MSPSPGKEVQLTALEIELLAPFIKRKILADETIAKILMTLADKLENFYKD